MDISVYPARSGHAPVVCLRVETGPAGLKRFQDRMRFRDQRALLRDQLVLACEVLHRNRVLPAGVDLSTLVFDGFFAYEGRGKPRSDSQKGKNRYKNITVSSEGRTCS